MNLNLPIPSHTLTTLGLFPIKSKRSQSFLARCKTAAFTLWLLLSNLFIQAQDGDYTYEGETLDPVVAEARLKIMFKELTDIDRLIHSVSIGKIAKDTRLVEYAEGFMERNQIEVLTIGYIDSDAIWPRVFKNQRLKKIEKADTDNLLVGKIIFVPVEDGEDITGYTVELQLSGKAVSVYELLDVSKEQLDLIAEETTEEELGSTEYAKPKLAQDAVVNAMILALQRVGEQSNTEPGGNTTQHVAFAAASNQHFGFDGSFKTEFKTDYPSIRVGGKSYRSAWKSLKSNTPDQVIATDPANQDLTFEFNGTPVTATSGADDTYSLTLTGQSDEVEGELLVKVGDYLAGQLNTISYDNVEQVVKIVPINGAGGGITQGQLQTKLNEIYGAAIASWNVEVLANQNLGTAWDDEGNGLEVGDNSTLSNYTSEMNDLIRAFKQKNDRDKKAYYVFLVNKAESSTYLGYMPRKKQWGFVFTEGQSTDQLITTIAHELGHGVYRLEHTFSEKGIPKGQTQNLMDYAGGTDLYKYQWDYVHDPESVVTLFDDEEDAASVSTLVVDQSTGIAPGQHNTYLTPAGIPYTVPDNTTKVSFTSNSGKAPYGTLTGYWVGADYHVGVYAELQFKGYSKLIEAASSTIERNEDGDIVYQVDELSQSLTSSSPVILGFPHQCKTYIGQLTINDFLSLKPSTPSNGSGTIGQQDDYQFIDIVTEPVDDEATCNISGMPVCDALYDKYKDSPLMQSSILAKIIEEDHCSLLGMKSFGEGLGYETDFMKGVKTMYEGFTMLFAVTAGSAILLPVIVEGLIASGTTVATEKTAEFTIGATMDGLIQLIIIYLSNDDITPEEAWRQVDVGQMLRSGGEATIGVLYAEVGVSCIGDAIIKSNGEIRDFDAIFSQEGLNECLIGGVSAYVGSKAADKLSAGAKKMMSNIRAKPEKFIELLTILRLSDDQIRSYAKKLGLTDELVELAIFKVKNATRLKNFDKADDLLADLDGNLPLIKSFNENADLVDSWAVLKNRPQLRVKPDALEALNKVRKNTKLGNLKITDDMLSKIEGIPNVSYAQILDDFDIAIKALPEGKVVDFQKVIADGQRGLVNKNNVWDRRHSWLTLKKVKENETFLKNADEIKFEVELEQIDGISNAVPDIVVTKTDVNGTTKKIIGEVKAGDNVITTNFNSQSLRYFQEIAEVSDLRLFRRDGVPLTKQQVVDSWKSGVTNNQKVRELFTDYYNKINDADLGITFTKTQLENFLSTNDNWFNQIFNSSF